MKRISAKKVPRESIGPKEEIIDALFEMAGEEIQKVPIIDFEETDFQLPKKLIYKHGKKQGTTTSSQIVQLKQKHIHKKKKRKLSQFSLQSKRLSPKSDTVLLEQKYFKIDSPKNNEEPHNKIIQKKQQGVQKQRRMTSLERLQSFNIAEFLSKNNQKNKKDQPQNSKKRKSHLQISKKVKEQFDRIQKKAKRKGEKPMKAKKAKNTKKFKKQKQRNRMKINYKVRPKQKLGKGPQMVNKSFSQQGQKVASFNNNRIIEHLKNQFEEQALSPQNGTKSRNSVIAQKRLKLNQSYSQRPRQSLQNNQLINHFQKRSPNPSSKKTIKKGRGSFTESSQSSKSKQHDNEYKSFQGFKKKSVINRNQPLVNIPEIEKEPEPPILKKKSSKIKPKRRKEPEQKTKKRNSPGFLQESLEKDTDLYLESFRKQEEISEFNICESKEKKPQPTIKKIRKGYFSNKNFNSVMPIYQKLAAKNVFGDFYR